MNGGISPPDLIELYPYALIIEVSERCRTTDCLNMSYDPDLVSYQYRQRRGLYDRTVVKDHEGHLYIPGSSVKGV